MMKMYTAYTSEVDDIEVAVSELKEQLALEGLLLKNTIGILSCYADFIETGVYAALCETFDFDIVGTTTLGCAVPGGMEDIMLALTVMTSDDVFFSVGLSEQITQESEEPFREPYKRALAALPAEPALILSFAPLLMNVGGDYLVKAFDDISGGVPNFGTVAVDHNDDYHEAVVLINGESYADRYAFVLLGGAVDPHFYVATISNEKIFKDKGVVTASQGNQLQTVNNMPVVDYLVSLGLQKNADGSITGINSFPFIMDLNDGMMPIVRVMFALTPEGYAVCGGDVPVGATLSVGSIDADEVIETTERKLLEAIGSGGYDCFLIFSCVGRYFSLGYNPMGEMEKLQEVLDDSGVPYHFAYAGTEISPVYGRENDESLMNRSHNDTCIICAF